MKTTLSPVVGMAILFCLFVLMFIIISFVSSILMAKMTSNIAGAVRIATLLQDIFVFILPAVVTAILMTRLPARFMFIDSAPRIVLLLLALLTLFAAMPWMNRVIEWNNSVSFPEGFGELERQLRAAEDAAQEFVNNILKGASVGSLIVSVCIVGILAALSEELFFRGTLLRLFTQTRMGHHAAIWIVAVIFSLLHFQFFGFVPRMLLGAYFGYLTWWSRCLWIPVIVHAVNNSTVVVAQWSSDGDASELAINTIGNDGTHWAIILFSVIFTILGLYLFRKCSKI